MTIYEGVHSEVRAFFDSNPAIAELIGSVSKPDRQHRIWTRKFGDADRIVGYLSTHVWNDRAIRFIVFEGVTGMFD